jgi:hypothetical protein
MKHVLSNQVITAGPVPNMQEGVLVYHHTAYLKAVVSV